VEVGEECGVAIDEANIDLHAVCIDGETVERRVMFVVVVLFDVREVSFFKVDGLPVRNIIEFVLS
jgi:hypothetical protein